MNRCPATCRNATSYRCRCSCGGTTHASISGIRMSQTIPALSKDMAPGPRHWTRDATASAPRPLPLEFPPPYRQISFDEIAAIWPEMEPRAA